MVYVSHETLREWCWSFGCPPFGVQVMRKNADAGPKARYRENGCVATLPLYFAEQLWQATLRSCGQRDRKDTKEKKVEEKRCRKKEVAKVKKVEEKRVKEKEVKEGDEEGSGNGGRA